MTAASTSGSRSSISKLRSSASSARPSWPPRAARISSRPDSPPAETSGSGRSAGVAGRRRPAVPRRPRPRRVGGFFPAGQDAVDGVDELLEAGVVPVAGPRHRTASSALIRPGLDDSTRIRSASWTASSMLWVTIRIALTGNVVALPQPGQLAAQVRRGEHVQRGERLVHQQRVGFDGQGPGEPDALAHAAGQLLGVGGLEAVQADQVDRAQCLVAPRVLGHVAGLHGQLHVLLHGQPGQQGEGLEHHGHARVRAVQRGAPVGHRARGRGDQAGDAAQQSGLARAGLAQQRDDLALAQGERDAVQDRQRPPVGGGERLGDVPGLDDDRPRRRGRCRPARRAPDATGSAHSEYLVSARRYSRRHTSRLSPTTYTLITATPISTLGSSPTVAAWAM